MFSHRAGETKPEDRRGGVPRPPLYDLCVKLKGSNKGDEGDVW